MRWSLDAWKSLRPRWGSGSVGAAAAEDAEIPDVVLVAQLWSKQFQHQTTLALAAAAGVLILVQAEIATAAAEWWTSLILFAISAGLSLLGQLSVLDEAMEGRLPSRQVRFVRMLAIVFLGAGATALVDSLT